MTIDGGIFFFTVVLADRSSTLLVDHIARLRRIHESVRKRLPFEVVAVCVLPDHIHVIWALPVHDSNYSLRWSLIKSGFSRGLVVDTVRSPSKARKRERGVWQRRYWEHTIRDDADLARHVDYIHFNPVRHGHVSRVVDWPYSSFHRYVRDGILASDWAGDALDLGGQFGE
ncbi:transposase [Rhodoplanes azumiensis]|uniref:Transposase n=2 Tax=Rhodoplanes azumiensis TaxID=1897628 RepID=A0ABW5AQU5_9BRAD